MNHPARYLSVFLLTGFSTALVFACGGEGSRNGGSGSPTGGQGTGGEGAGAEPGSGGTTGGDGGTNAGSGGSGGSGEGTGGTGNAQGFVCPSGFEGMTPTLPGSPVSGLTEAPAVGVETRFLEGPVWDGTYLYVSQIRDYGPLNPSRILRLEGASLVPFIPDERAGTNGLAVRGDGKLVAATHRVRGLTLIDPSEPEAEPEVIVDEYMGNGFNSPNDLALHSSGSIYFTDPDYQCGESTTSCPQQNETNTEVVNRVYRVLPNGTVEAVDPPHTKPNGIALSLDESILYVAGNNAGIHAYTLDSTGAIGAGSEFANVSGVDGMTLDCAGNLYATVHSQGRVDVFTPNGQLHGSIQLASGTVTNVAFGGTDRQTLYITGGPNLYAVELDIPGLPY